MVGSSKILTVSYGTFSCTLEGFDDPFNTMRSIAEYFRDLAADDRYFGAEPPTPDAEMLHRIAEREARHRVESRVDGNSVVLRPAAGAVEQAEPKRAADAARSRPAPPAAETVAPAIAPVRTAPGNESIVEKLQRIRAAVARSQNEPPTIGADADDEFAPDVKAGAAIATAFAGIKAEPAEEADVAQIYADIADADDEAESDEYEPEADEGLTEAAEVEAPEDALAEDVAENASEDLAEDLGEVTESDAADVEDAAGDQIDSMDAEADVTVEAMPDADVAEAETKPEEAVADEIGAAEAEPEEADVEADVAEAAEETEVAEAVQQADVAEVAEEAGVAEPAEQIEAEDVAETVEDRGIAELAEEIEAAEADEQIDAAEAEVVAADEDADVMAADEQAEVAEVAETAEVEDDGGDIVAEQYEDAVETDETAEAVEEPLDVDDVDLSAIRQILSGETPQETVAPQDEVAAQPAEEAIAEPVSELEPDLDEQAFEAEAEAEEQAPEVDEQASEAEELLPGIETVVEEQVSEVEADVAAEAEAEAEAEDQASEIAAELEAEIADIADAEQADEATEETGKADIAASEPLQLTPGSRVRARVVKMRREEFEAQFEQDDEDEGDADTGAAVEEEVRAELGDTGLAPDAEDELVAELAAAQLDEDIEAALPDAGTPEEAPRLKRRIHDGEPAVDRIMQQTKSELDSTDSNQRRSAIAHLKAAVAAVRADGRLREGEEPAKRTGELGRYRDDLARAVRPERKTPAEGEPARRVPPLMLVSEQRVDKPDASGAPVHPRRVSGPADIDGGEDDEQSQATRAFAAFAESHGAADLPDLLEASAAFAAFVEGEPFGSRADIIRRVNHYANKGDFSREDTLRAFGTLLRDGRLVKLRRGVFAVADDTRFQPDAKSAAG